MHFHEQYYPESRFGGFSNIDGTVVFYSRVHALLQPASVVVDVGCGRGAYTTDPLPYRRNLRILKGKCRRVIGLDLDPGAKDNPFLDEFFLIEGARWPLADATADLCLADNVLEHVESPDNFFAECRRILQTGGMLCIRTPNLLSYFGLLAKLIPNPQHAQWLQKVKDTPAEDIFPPFYRCNTLPKLRKMLQKHGFEAVLYGYDAEPSYLSFSRLFYWLGVLHQRFAPQLFKVGLHAFGRKIAL